MTQNDLLADVLKSAPEAVTAALVLVTVFAFLRHMRAMSREFLDALVKRDEALADLTREIKDHRADTARVLEAVRER